MMMDRIFCKGPAVRRDLRLAQAINKFVFSNSSLNEEKVRGIRNLFYVDVVDGELEYSDLANLDIGQKGRSLEVRFATAIAVTFPEFNVGLTRCSKDGAVDIAVETQHGIIFFDTKDSEKASDKISEESRKRLEKFDRWMLYVSPSRSRSFNGVIFTTKNIKVLSVQNAILNMTKSKLLDTYGKENLRAVTRIEETLGNLCK